MAFRIRTLQKIMTMNMEHACRICLHENAIHNIFLTMRSHNSFKVGCDEMMIAVFSLSVNKDDGFPKKICRKCFSKLSSAYRLKKLAENSHKTLSDHRVQSERFQEIIKNENEIKIEYDVKDEDSDTVESRRLIIDLSKSRHPNVADLSDDNLTLTKQEEEDSSGDRDLGDDYGFDDAVASSFFIGVDENLKPDDPERNEDVPCDPRTPRKKSLIKRKKKHKTVKVSGKRKRVRHIEAKVAPRRTVPTVCPLCGKQVVDMDTHSETHKPNSEKRKLPCKECPKVFISQSSRRRHVLVHHLGQMYHCGICDKDYKHGDQHNRMVHSVEPKPLGCPLCDKRFFTKAQLDIHLTSHTKERAFPCSVCGKGFRTRTDSEIHRRSVHEKERNIMCQYCPKGFFSNADLRKHLCTHTNERKYKCTECDKSFYRSSQLKIHLQRHLGIKNVQCSLCDKTFYTISNLKIHMISHTKEKNHPCKYCGVKFGRTHHRDRHQKTAHENKLDKECGAVDTSVPAT